MQNKFRGVSAHKDGGWTAFIGFEGKRRYLGWYREFEQAKEARLAAEVELFGVVFDRRPVDVREDHALIPLHGQKGVFYGYAMVDLCDLDDVKDIAWTLDPRGYVAGRPPGAKSSTTLHRWIFFGLAKGGGVDHIDGNRIDNRRVNLRLATQAQNSRNTRLATNNTSGFKGVSRTAEGRWRARITINRIEVRLGHFDTQEQAAAAYDAASATYHGEFASPNGNYAELRKGAV